MKVKIADIKVGERMRQLDMNKVSELAESIKDIGLLHAITITSDLRLLAGLHRIEAFKLLGLDEIEADIKELEPLKQELAEIDENLIRSDLHYLDRGKHYKRRKEIYEMLYPETKAGGDRKSEEFRSKRKEDALKPSFSEDAAAKTGVSPRTVQHEVQLVTKLAPEVQKEIREIDVKKKDALRLVRKIPKVEDQLRVLKKLREKKATSVKQAEGLVHIEKDIENGSRLKLELDATFKIADWREEIRKLNDCEVGSIVASIPSDLSVADFQLIFDHSARFLKDGGTLVVQVDTAQIPLVFICTIPTELSYRGICVNVMSRVESDDENSFKSSWMPVVVFTKGPKKLAGADMFTKAFEQLTKVEDGSLQIVTRFSSKGDLVVDPFVGTDLMSCIGAAVGRKFIGFAKDEVVVNIAKSKLDQVKDVIAAI